MKFDNFHIFKPLFFKIQK
uniref:Uncharacterized protein n=1 Tax=Arundo donax TaxID=35708 RepID=A0A0A9EEP5_ARUDO